MNIFVVTTPGTGHVMPLLPLIGAFLARGDRVTVAAGEDARAAVTGAGAEFFPAGHGEAAWFATLRRRTRGLPGDGLAPERINQYFVPRLFAEIAADDMIDDVVACGRRVRPDLVLFETYALAGPLVADVLGVPGVHHAISPLLPLEVSSLADDAVSPLWRSFGRDTPGHAGLYRALTISVCPPALQPDRVPAGGMLPMKPVAAPGAGAPGGRPKVWVTLGTSFNTAFDVFRAAIDGLAGQDVDVVATVGSDVDPARLGPVPGNTTVARFIPAAALLPRCAAVVHHGGSGTMLAALAHGLPQLLLPQGADNYLNAGLLTRAGMGLALRPDETGPDAVAHAVRELLRDSCYREAARTAAAEIASMPNPAAVATELAARLGQGEPPREPAATPSARLAC